MSARKHEGAPLAPSLPITPMLDMTFQLFAFFVLTYHPHPEEGILDLVLPGKAIVGRQEPVAPLAGAELASGLTVEIRAVRQGPTAGALSQITVKSRAGDTPVPELAALRLFLNQALAEVAPAKDIQIAADSQLKYAHVMDVVDHCRRAGFAHVGFGPPPDLGIDGN